MHWKRQVELQFFFANVKTNKYIIHLTKSVAMALKSMERLYNLYKGLFRLFCTVFPAQPLPGRLADVCCRTWETVDSSMLGAFQLKPAAFLEHVC